ncbi:MAG: glycosyltransferase [Candidatus Omnitrophica bacterium]|nr:glycosyltransferase [Candidatus Omnitrophota bacterium]
MKILFVVPNYEPAWAFGGVARCISTLCRGLAGLGEEVTVYTTNVDGRGKFLSVTPGEAANVGGVTVRYFSSTFGPGSDWDSRDMVHVLEREIKDFDIVYVSATWHWIGVSLAGIAGKHNVPYVVGLHGGFHPNALKKGWLKKFIWRKLFLKKYLEGAKALIFSTEYEEQSSKKFVPQNVKRIVVPNSLSIEEKSLLDMNSLDIRGEYGIIHDSFLLVTVSRPDPAKRVDVLLKSFKKVLKDIPDASLLMVGDFENSYGRRMKKLAEDLELSQRVFWAGHLTGEALNSCYKASDLFVLTSAHENFSMATAEAMISGLPVVVSRHVGIAGDIEKNGAGVVVDLEEEKIAEAIISLEKDANKQKEMGRKAEETAQELYGAEQVARKMLDVFKKAI